jgi:phosphoribosylaminoimidazole (AIR) synthetase
MGIGLVLVVAPEHVDAVQRAVELDSWVIGAIAPGEREVVLE